jgi:hypothetical protein
MRGIIHHAVGNLDCYSTRFHEGGGSVMEIKYIFSVEICYGANLHNRKVHREQLHEKYFIEKRFQNL